MTHEDRILPPREAEPDVAELKALVEAKEVELSQSIDRLMDALGNALDWRRVVAEHPLECALGAATLGFMVTYRPEFMGRPAEASLKTVMNLGAESLVKAAASHFMSGRASGS